MDKLYSSYLGYISVNSQTIYTKLSKEILVKVGEWDEIEQKPNFTSQPNWYILNDDEKLIYLSYYHELKHFLDITSLPAGAFHWRLWNCINEYCDIIFHFLKELDLLNYISFPLINWMQNSGKSLIKNKLLERKKIFGSYFSEEDVDLIFSDFAKELPNLINRYKKVAVELFNDINPCATKYAKELTFISKDMKHRFSTDRVFQASDYERLPYIRWLARREKPEYNQEHYLSFSEIFEFRAYLSEALIINRHQDRKFFEMWLERLKSIVSQNLYNKIKVFASPNVSHTLPMYLTDIALSGCIDINCHFFMKGFNSEKPNIVDFYNNWPSQRLAKIFESLNNINVIYQNDLISPLQIMELAYSMFGHDTFPETGIKISRRKMIPREFRTPFKNKNIEDYTNYGNDFVTEKSLGIEPWNSRRHLENINNVFLHNQENYIKSFLQTLGDEIKYISPSVVFFNDFISWNRNNNGYISVMNSVIHSQLVINLFFSKNNPLKIQMQNYSLNNIQDKSFREKLVSNIKNFYGINLVQQIFNKLD